jgi:hypothetical protein
MSGIILPGKDPEPKNEGKIELPSGFSRKRAAKEEKQTESVVPEQVAEQAAAGAASGAGAGEGQGRRQPGAEFLLPPRGAQVQCPQCGASYVVPVFTIIDLGANPELKSPLLGGQINVAMCAADRAVDYVLDDERFSREYDTSKMWANRPVPLCR